MTTKNIVKYASDKADIRQRLINELDPYHKQRAYGSDDDWFIAQIFSYLHPSRIIKPNHKRVKRLLKKYQSI